MNELSVSVKGRINFANDLHAADAVYHVTHRLELGKVCPGNILTLKI